MSRETQAEVPNKEPKFLGSNIITAALTCSIVCVVCAVLLRPSTECGGGDGYSSSEIVRKLALLVEQVSTIGKTLKNVEKTFVNENTQCGVRWYKVYENDASGEPVSGSIVDLRAAVLSGADLRISSALGYTITSVQNVQIVDGNVCAQALFHVSKNGYDRFQDNVYWWWVIASTTGHWQMTRYNVGEHVSRGSNEVKYNITWFVRHRCNRSPILDIDNNAKVTSGSITSLIEAVQNGEDIRIATDGSYSFPADNLEYDVAESMVGAMSIWSVSMIAKVVDRTKINSFQGNDYWWFTQLSSNGNRHMSRWTVGQHQARGDTSDKVTSQWFADPCWRMVYQHDSEGNPTCGTMKNLLEAVNTGHRIRLAFRRSVFEADTLTIKDGQVCAQVLNDLSKTRVDSFQSSVHWVWRHVCSSGVVETIRYEVGSNTNAGTTNESESITWFADVREWQHVLTTKETGSVSAGSKAVLVHAVRNGAELRYRTNGDGYSVVRQADNISISGEEVGAMHVREISLSFSGFHSNPYWFFTIVSTTGRRDASRWTVGVHQDRGHTEDKVKVDWFVGE